MCFAERSSELKVQSKVEVRKHEKLLQMGCETLMSVNAMRVWWVCVKRSLLGFRHLVYHTGVELSRDTLSQMMIKLRDMVAERHLRQPLIQRANHQHQRIISI